MSWGVAVKPLTVTFALKAIRIESESSREKAKRSGFATPTSDPSKNRLQFCPSNFQMSSSEEDMPAMVWLLVSER